MAEMFLLSALAEALTEAVVSQAIGRISDLLINEARSLTSVRHEVESLRNELRRIQSFLRSTSGEQGELVQDERVRNWVSEIRDIASEIEDVIEMFIVKADSSHFKTFHLQSLRRRINLIKAKLKSNFESRKNYGIPIDNRNRVSLSGSPRRSQLRRCSPEEEEEEDVVVGQESCLCELKARLMEHKECLCAVAVVGMGGLGKSTVTRRVYNDDEVKRHFECRAWVLISQEFVARDVFSEILIQIGASSNTSDVAEEETRRERERLKTMEEYELIRTVRDKLRGQRYLLVFDDVGKVEDFDSIKRIFPRGRGGSKVVFTTRMREVASSVDPAGSPMQLPFLSHEESWSLLHRKAFPNDVFGERPCPPDFQRMGREMVKQCGGLPLAIVVLGGLLRTKNSEDEWKKVRSDVNSHISTHKSGVSQMLALSYHDLPYYLKPCLLYLGSFPEEFERKELIQLWIAEGLVIEPETSRGQTMEDIAEHYLRELINRCMVQVGNRHHTGESIKTCGLHNLMRDFCVAKARTDNFCRVIQRHEIEHFTSTAKPRRLSIHPGCSLQPRQMHPNLRSLLCFEINTPNCLQQILRSKNLRLLRVLKIGFDRKTTRKCNVPVEIGGLILLRYLGLRGGGRVKLPSSIENLRSLTTINLRHNDEVFLPVEIFRLKSLKHLLLPLGTSYPYPFTWMTYAVSDTTQIQTLKFIRFGPLLLKNKLVQSDFTSLGNLGVEFKSAEEVTMLMASPNFELSSLHSLHMSLLSRIGFLDLQPLARCVVLSKLRLDGKLYYDCHKLDFLPESLTKLILRDSGITEDPMTALEKLPNLRFLQLDNAFVGSRMVCSAGRFRKLETLVLVSMEEVKEWQVKENAMPLLKRLYIKHMPNLMIPDGLKYLPSFKDVIESE